MIHVLLLFMDTSPANTLPDSSPDAPLDPDRAFTLWVLGRLAEVVEIGIRTAHRIEQQQIVAALQPGPPKADFALMQERIARAVRLSIALASRLREAHITRKFGATTRDAAAVAAGRQRRQEAVTRIATAAIAAGDVEDAEFRTTRLHERLVEREFENELETLPAREVLTRIHHLLGIEPDQDQWPKHWPDEAAEMPDEAGPEPDTGNAVIDPEIGDERMPDRPDPGLEEWSSARGSERALAQDRPGAPDDS
jgi:hypothetical protein